MNLEKIRRDVTLVGKAIESHDEIVGNIVESRWKHDMISEMPELGAARDRSGQVRVIPSSELRQNLEDLEKQRVVAERVATRLTGTADMDGARGVYLDVLTAYQRVGSLRELERMLWAGSNQAREEALSQGLEWFTESDGDVTIPELKAAVSRLEKAASVLDTEVSLVDRVQYSLSL